MLTFVVGLAVGYLSFVFLSSGVFHLMRLGTFRTIVRGHGVLGSRAATAAAVGVAAVELVAGAAMVAVAIERASTAIEIILAGGVLAGVVFTLYLRRVLTTAVGIVSCGCSPLGGPFTAASLLPAMLLSLLSALGLAAGLAGRSAGSGPILADPRALAGIGWGVTLAGLVLLFPASAPSVEAKGGLS